MELKCKWPRCRGMAEVFYLGVMLCEKHHQALCELDGWKWAKKCRELGCKGFEALPGRHPEDYPVQIPK